MLSIRQRQIIQLKLFYYKNNNCPIYSCMGMIGFLHRPLSVYFASIHHYKYLPLNVYVVFFLFQIFLFFLSAIKAISNECNFSDIKIHEFKILHCAAEGNSQYQKILRDRFGFRMDCAWMDSGKIFHLMIWITNMKNGLRSGKANHKQIYLENKVGASLYNNRMTPQAPRKKQENAEMGSLLMWFVCYNNELVLYIVITVNIKLHLYDIMKGMCCFPLFSLSDTNIISHQSKFYTQVIFLAIS